jgi:CRISPR type III-A-associated protein Csm2
MDDILIKKRCTDCGQEFIPKETHHKVCANCNRKRRQGAPGSDRSAKLADDYLKDGYFDGKGHLRAAIFKDEAKHVAGVLAELRMTPTSLRAFYNKLKALENRYKASANDFNVIRPSLYAFERDVAYQVSRQVVPEEFRKFININADLAIRGPREFKGFVEHFLSVLAYFKDVAK